MEMTIYKNRPTPNIDINLVEDNQSLEIVRRIDPDTIAGRMRLNRSTAMELANGIREFIRTYKLVRFENEFDEVEICGGGTEYRPAVFIHVNHRPLSGVMKGWASHFLESETEILAQALERWAKHPDL